jgi:hypothetical protein
MTQSEAASLALRSGEASDSLHPDDLRVAAALSREALIALGEADWSKPAHGLEWSCRKTLQHMTSAVDWYAMLLAMPSLEPFRVRFLPQPEYSAEYPLALLLAMLERKAAVLAAVATASDASARGFHGWGQPDPTGYVAMGCAEILLHTDDIVRGIGALFQAPDDLCRGVTARLFPWAPTDADPWPTLRWAVGRESLPGYADTPANWAWHASPVAEWDGTIKTKESYVPR